MNTSTTGIEIRSSRRWLADVVELLSSMRFAISLLTLIALASVIGTVMKQNEPLPNYVNQFGPFWFDVFQKLGLYTVYSAWWFLLIMAFLVVSTSLCILRNAPRMLKDMRSWRENVREQSLRNFHHKAEWAVAMPRAALVQQLTRRISAVGYKFKVVEKEGATLIAARHGAANKFGYIFAHSAIVVICIGGLLDSDMPISFQQWFNGKTPYDGGGVIAQIPAQHRLGLGNPTFRGNTMIPEGARSSSTVIPRQQGVLIQDLPFSIELKKFIIEYYSSGMPKLFASDVVVHDLDNGKQFAATIKVNQPLIYKGIAVYQSSFDDGGSRLKLAAYPMTGTQRAAFPVAGEVGGSSPLVQNANPAKAGDYTIEWTGFRALNIENTGAGQDVRAVNPNQTFNEKFAAGLDKRLGSAARNANDKNLKNVGPSVQYKLRDKSGQAREFLNYMQPVQLDGASVFLAGMRESPADPFSYIRIPADDSGGVDEWMRLRAALQDPALRDQAASRYALRSMPQTRAGEQLLRDQLQQSALKSLNIFAGNNDKDAGYMAVSKFLARIPAAEQEKAADIFMKILNGSLWDLWQVAREKDGLKPAAADEAHSRFLQLATNALSDATLYGAPVYLQLKGFEEVKASVFQVSRSPGKKVVYFGCLLLTLGVFAMFYIRERRLWLWVKDGSSGAQALMAMSTQRKTLDFEKEFVRLKTQLAQSA
jgi:cytochrome c biogenesis protein